MKKHLVILHLVWLSAAAGLYLLGRHHGGFGTGADTGSGMEEGFIIGRSLRTADSDPGAAPVAGTDDAPGQASPAAGTTGNTFIDGLLASRFPASGDQMQRGILEAYDEKDPLKSNMMFAQLLALLTPENAQAAIEALDELPRDSSRYGQMSLFRFAWGQLDGPAAAAHAASLSGRSKDYAASSVMSGWASRDPKAAMAWVEQLEDSGERSQFTRGIVRGIARSDTSLATGIAIEASTNGDGRAGDYIETIARELFREGIDTASRWLDSIPEDNGLRAGALREVAESYVDQDPALAAAWVQKYAGTGYAGRAIGEVADEWAESDPVAAINWINSLPAGEDRAQAFGHAAWEWTGRDPYAAAEYLAQMPAGSDRDAAVSGLAKRHVSADPESAIAWAGSIGDPELRVKTLTSTGQSWMRRDPAGASSWLQASGLPAEIQHVIANPPRSSDSYRR